jgi:hypothetical protein
MAAQLRDLGVQQVRQMSRVQDARLALEQSPYDIVLCEMTFDGAPMSGQDLLDELRREQLLPLQHGVHPGHRRGHVRAGAGSRRGHGRRLPRQALFGGVLAEKLTEVRRRKRSLKPIYDAMQAGDLPVRPHWRSSASRRARATGPLPPRSPPSCGCAPTSPSAALAICRPCAEKPAGLGQGRHQRACPPGPGRAGGGAPCSSRRWWPPRPDYADAHDLLGRVLVEQGEFGPALESFRTATDADPGLPAAPAAPRHAGLLPGHKAEAAQHIERTIALGRKSKLFDGLCCCCWAC